MLPLGSLDFGMIVEICGFLIGHGANIECKDLFDETALLKVAKSNLEGSPNWTRGLLQCGADSELQEKRSSTLDTQIQ